MLFQYWPTANGAGPPLKQQRVKSSSLQGELSAFGYRVPSVSGWNRLHRAVCTVQCEVDLFTYHKISATIQSARQQIVSLDIKGCFVKWQVHPFISKKTKSCQCAPLLLYIAVSHSH